MVSKKKKRARRQLTMGPNGLEVVFIDVDTGEVITDLSGYELISADGPQTPATADEPAKPETPAYVPPKPSETPNNDDPYSPVNNPDRTLGPIGMDDIVKGVANFNPGKNFMTWLAGTPIGQKFIKDQAENYIKENPTAVPDALAGAGDAVGALFGGAMDFIKGGTPAASTDTAQADTDMPDTEDVVGMGGTEVAMPSTGNLAEVIYAIKGKKRDQPVKDELLQQLQKGVTAVYGPGYKVVVQSGEGDYGSIRHSTATAADVQVFDPDGKELKKEALGPLAQHWLASDIGSVGFPSNGTSYMHLDLIGGNVPGSTPFRVDPKSGKMEGPKWFYGNPTPAETGFITAGLQGVAPKYRIPPDQVGQVIQASTKTPVDSDFIDKFKGVINTLKQSTGDIQPVTPHPSELGDQGALSNNSPATLVPETPQTQAPATPIDQGLGTVVPVTPSSQLDLTNTAPTVAPEADTADPYDWSDLLGGSVAPIAPISATPALDAYEGDENSAVAAIKEATLDTINQYEGSPKDNQAFGYVEFDPSPTHPGIYNKEHNSTAAGPYQVNKETWDDYAAQFGVTDFSSKADQKKFSWELAKMRYEQYTGGNLVKDMLDGKSGQVLKALAPTWEGFKGKSADGITDTFNNYMKKHTKGTIDPNMDTLGRPFGSTPFEAGVGTGGQTATTAAKPLAPTKTSNTGTGFVPSKTKTNTSAADPYSPATRNINNAQKNNGDKNTNISETATHPNMNYNTTDVNAIRPTNPIKPAKTSGFIETKPKNTPSTAPKTGFVPTRVDNTQKEEKTKNTPTMHFGGR